MYFRMVTVPASYRGPSLFLIDNDSSLITYRLPYTLDMCLISCTTHQALLSTRQTLTGPFKAHILDDKRGRGDNKKQHDDKRGRGVNVESSLPVSSLASFLNSLRHEHLARFLLSPDSRREKSTRHTTYDRSDGRELQVCIATDCATREFGNRASSIEHRASSSAYQFENVSGY